MSKPIKWSTAFLSCLLLLLVITLPILLQTKNPWDGLGWAMLITVYFGIPAVLLILLVVLLNNIFCKPDHVIDSEKMVEEKREISFTCPFCEKGMYDFGRCPNCNNTIDQMVLEAYKNRKYPR